MTDLTIDEAEAWRAGYRAALEAAAAVLAARVDEMAGVALDDTLGSEHRRRAETQVAALDRGRHAIRALPIPDPPPMPDGLCGRGA